MIFEILHEAAQRNELILIDGGYCRFHLLRNGQITVYEILSMRKGAGSEMLEMLKGKNPDSILAKCPTDLPANGWYQHKGFILEGVEETKSGRRVNIWRLRL